MQQMIVLASPDGVVDMTPQAIAARTSIPLNIITKGLKVLSEPDPYTRTPGEDGRRLVLMDDHRPWGWRLVNHGKYMRLRSAEQKRTADRERIAEKRKKNKDVAIVSHPVANVAHSDTDTDVKQDEPGGSLVDSIWGPGLQVLLTAKVREDHARSFLGAILATWEASDVMDALQAAAGKADPRGYVRAVLKSKPRKSRVSVAAAAVLAALRKRYGEEVRLASDEKDFYEPGSNRRWFLDGNMKAAL